MQQTMPRVRNAIRVLLIEDDEDDALLILRRLTDHGFKPTADRVDSLGALRGHLENNGYDVIISDYSLPSFTATHALQCVRDAAPDTPLVVVSGRIGEETAVSLVKQGASDFLNKDRLARVGIAVENVIHQKELEVANRAAEAEQRAIEERLCHAEKMEAVGHLAGGIAHDFNNLLSIILNYADTAIDDLACGRARPDDLLKIRNAAERGATLTRQLLSFSRKEIIKPEVLDLRTILEEMMMFLGSTIGNDIDLIVNMPRDLWAVEADRGRLDQVLMNLVVNGRDAMAEDGGDLTIDAENIIVSDRDTRMPQDLQTGRYVRITVTDSGTGMSPDVVQKMFDPFFTTKPPGEGTGLGLATVHGVVTQAGGVLDVDTQPGHGTAISVFLPATDLPAAAKKMKRTRARTSHETVLVIEDEEELKDLVRRTLLSQGYHVLVADCGADALEIARDDTQVIDLIVADIVMSRVAGREVMEEIRRLRPQSNILFMSGHAEGIFDFRGTVEPGRLLLQNPFSQIDLLNMVRIALEEDIS